MISRLTVKFLRYLVLDYVRMYAYISASGSLQTYGAV